MHYVACNCALSCIETHSLKAPVLLVAAQAPTRNAVLTGNQYLTVKKLALLQRDLHLPPGLLDFNFVKPAYAHACAGSPVVQSHSE